MSITFSNPYKMEPLDGIEPSTYSLRVNCSTPELQRLNYIFVNLIPLEMLNNQRFPTTQFLANTSGCAIVIFPNSGSFLMRN